MINRLTSAVTTTAALVALAFALALVSSPSHAADVTAGNVAEHIASAKTAADHQAIAGYFRSEAAAQAERVKLHEEMLASYQKAGGKPYANIMDHCKKLIAESRKLQQDYAMMAEMHEQMAKSVGKGS